jgi:hypothetical protein
MSDEKSEKATLKQKAAHEFKELAAIFLYLAFFFCALATYSMLLLNRFNVSYFTYGAALINALVIAKVILIGEYAHLGRKHESKPLVVSALYKAFLYGLLVFAFHVLEECIRLLVHHESIASGFRQIQIDEFLCRTLIVFCTFIPLFAFRELRRVLGEENFHNLFFRTGGVSVPELPGKA